MAIRRFDDALSHSLLRPAGLASLALGVLLGACASGTAGDTGRRDAAPAGSTGGNGGGGGQGGGGAGGKGGATGGNGGGGSSGACDPIANTGCGSGEKCTALQQNGLLTLGCDGKGSKNEGDLCNQTVTGSVQTDDDCGTGLACFKAGKDETAATCHRICPLMGNDCACPSGEICRFNVGSPAGYAFCRSFVPCQPLDQTGCGDGEACYFSTDACYTGPLCAGAGSKKPGEACAASNECEKGSTCLMLGSSGTCTAFCSTESGGTPSCSGGDTCAALGGSDDKVGSCRSS